MDNRTTAMKLAWDEGADDYLHYLGPRFLPWLEDAVEALAQTPTPPAPAAGPTLVTCCGPGVELALLALRLPERPLLGVDLSARMIQLAQHRCRGMETVRLAVADATDLPDDCSDLCGLLSCFGLQLLPDPPTTLTHWCSRLAPGASAVVMYWPPERDPDDPFHTLIELLSARMELPAPDWEPLLVQSIEGASCQLAEDRLVHHEMRHDSAAALWEGIVDTGMWRLIRQMKGDAFLTELRDAFMMVMPQGPIAHRSAARMLVARRDP